MIRFGKSHIIGFASIQDETFDWDQPGLNVIQAPNGHGKTKFINALVWALFGKTLAGSVITWEHKQPNHYRGTKVDQVFWNGNDEYRVIRCKDYLGDVDGAKGKNRLIVKINGEDPTNVRDKGDYQAVIMEALGYSFELFKNTIVFGQKLQRLISETGPNKKKVLDDAFEVTFIPRAKKLVESEKQKLMLEIETQTGIYNLAKAQIDLKLESLEQAEKAEASFEETKQANINKERESITKLEDKLSQPQFKNLDKEISKLSLQTKREGKLVLSQKTILDKASEKEREANSMDNLVKDNAKLTRENDVLNKSLTNLPKE